MAGLMNVEPLPVSTISDGAAGSPPLACGTFESGGLESLRFCAMNHTAKSAMNIADVPPTRPYSKCFRRRPLCVDNGATLSVATADVGDGISAAGVRTGSVSLPWSRGVSSPLAPASIGSGKLAAPAPAEAATDAEL